MPSVGRGRASCQTWFLPPVLGGGFSQATDPPTVVEPGLGNKGRYLLDRLYFSVPKLHFIGCLNRKLETVQVENHD